jgi:gliding motility-associated-like protein
LARLNLIVNPLVSSITSVATCDNRLPYNWNGNTYSATGTYYVTLQSAAGCDSVARLDLVVNPVVRSSTSATTCANRLPYNWNGQSFTAGGTYIVTLQSVAGCDSLATLNLTVNPVPTSTTNSAVCTNRLPYVWNGQSYNASGSYVVTLRSSLGCDSLATLNLAVNPIPTSTTNVTRCVNELPYIWNGQSYTATGRYDYRLTSAAGCDSIATLVLQVNQLPEVTISGPDSLCIGLSANLNIRLSGRAPWTIIYREGNTLRTINNITSSPYSLVVTPQVSTFYEITSVRDANCINNGLSVQKVIHITSPVAGRRLPTVNAISGTQTQLQARVLGPQYTYLWSPPDGLSSRRVSNPLFNFNRGMEYEISMTSGPGCVTVDTLLVKTINNSDPGLRPDLKVPKAWTPNGDGHNDELFPFTINIREIKYFRIYNRWGQLMYETRELGRGWDGVYKGQKQPIDAYTWTVEGIGLDGTVIRKTGNSALLR